MMHPENCPRQSELDSEDRQSFPACGGGRNNTSIFEPIAREQLHLAIEHAYLEITRFRHIGAGLFLPPSLREGAA